MSRTLSHGLSIWAAYPPPTPTPNPHGYAVLKKGKRKKEEKIRKVGSCRETKNDPVCLKLDLPNYGLFLDGLLCFVKFV